MKIFQENVPARIYEQPLLLQPNPSTLILEAHIHANPKPKVDLKKYFLRNFLKYSQISWLCNGDFVKESDRKQSTLTSMEGERNKWAARMTIMVSWSSVLVQPGLYCGDTESFTELFCPLSFHFLSTASYFDLSSCLS